MNSFTRKAALACTLVAAITLGTAGVSYAATPIPVGPPNIQVVATTPEVTQDPAEVYLVTNEDNLSEIARVQLRAAIEAAQSNTSTNPITISILKKAEADKLAAAKASVAIYTAGRAQIARALTAYDGYVKAGPIPFYMTKGWDNNLIALDKLIGAHATDAEVKTKTAALKASIDAVPAYQQKFYEAVAWQERATTLKGVVLTYATRANIDAIKAAGNAIVTEIHSATTSTAGLDKRITAVKTAITAGEKSSADRSGPIQAGNSIYSKAKAASDTYGASANPGIQKQLSAALAAYNTAKTVGTGAQVSAAAKTVQVKSAAVTDSAQALRASKRLAGKATTAYYSKTRAPKANRAALWKANGALGAAVRAKATPATLAPLNKKVQDALNRVITW
ncbi:hypothetical protein [Leifsonia sp. Leaf264]|uniref:hypothetical protein n=1 Tax=Leifsonia sp. Leaf264 TaxID=1736314 RepID=UPI0007019BF9|nr:hypothetical protein [Leifsonia sp. Leaf264]KQO98419.1 hypothetical protein ASF30_10180 [Leifsonia sp. Leaf264]